MLMYIFGAGASYDSDPERRPDSSEDWQHEHRPPLAAGLFAPTSLTGKEVVARYPRAAPIMVRLRQAVARGEDVEEVLEALANLTDYPELDSQLLAFRAYLTDLLWEVPRKWSAECQALTNYVALLDQSDRHATRDGKRDRIACVTFNYDTLLEEAVASVYGHEITSLERYLNHPRVRVYKPHGSAHWQVPASWDERAFYSGREHALRVAIARAQQVRFHEDEPWRLGDPGAPIQELGAPDRIWLPAISIPVRNKATFSLPPDHQAELADDLAQVTTIVAVGWRGRESHFLRLLEGAMPAGTADLLVVSANVADARSAVDSLWRTGRFGRFSISTRGFSGFVEEATAVDPPDGSGNEGSRLDSLLSDPVGSITWTRRRPGEGLEPRAS